MRDPRALSVCAILAPCTGKARPAKPMHRDSSTGQRPIAFGIRVSFDFLRFQFSALATRCACPNPLSGLIHYPV
jgi:hypothetical protein